MVWSIDLDVLNTFPLLNVIRDSLLDYNPEAPVLQSENTDDEESSFTSNSGALLAVVFSSVGFLAVGSGAYYMFIAKKALESTMTGGDVEDLADLAVPKRKKKATAEGTQETTLDVKAQESLRM